MNIDSGAQMKPIRLEKDSKYYAIHLTTDLFGDLVLVCDYGSMLSKRSHRITKVVGSKKEAELVSEKIIKTRYNHGYDVV